MRSYITFALSLAATAANGILVGASLDQSIKQLPARHRIGVLAYSQYSQAADLSNGIAWYAIVGEGAALLTIAAAIAAYRQRHNLDMAWKRPLYVAAGLSVLHSLATTQAAPIMFSQRTEANDEVALHHLFDCFARWQTVRAALQVLTLGAMLWALAVKET